MSLYSTQLSFEELGHLVEIVCISHSGCWSPFVLFFWDKRHYPSRGRGINQQGHCRQAAPGSRMRHHLLFCTHYWCFLQVVVLGLTPTPLASTPLANEAALPLDLPVGGFGTSTLPSPFGASPWAKVIVGVGHFQRACNRTHLSRNHLCYMHAKLTIFLSALRILKEITCVRVFVL